MFPTANSVVHYNEFGEPTGWDTYREEDPFDYYDESVDLYGGGGGEDEIDPEDCEHGSVFGIREYPDGRNLGECADCGFEVWTSR